MSESVFPKVDGDVLYGTEVNRVQVFSSDLLMIGDGQDGSRTISSNTTEVAVLFKAYENLTIDNNFTWTLTGSINIIRVHGTLTLGTNSIIDGLGVSGTTGGPANGVGGVAGGASGSSGTLLYIFAKKIVCGTGSIIRASGSSGGSPAQAGAATGSANGNSGSAGSNTTWYNVAQTNAADFGRKADDGTGTGGSIGSGAGGIISPLTIDYFRTINLWPLDVSAKGSAAGSGNGTNASNSIGGGGGAGSGGSFWGAGGSGGRGADSDGGSSTGNGGSGGGGGGAGGMLCLVYSQITSPANLTVGAGGGNGGNGGSASGATKGKGGAGGGGGGGVLILAGPSASTVTASVAGGSAGSNAATGNATNLGTPAAGVVGKSYVITVV